MFQATMTYLYARHVSKQKQSGAAKRASQGLARYFVGELLNSPPYLDQMRWNDQTFDILNTSLRLLVFEVLC